MGLGAVVMTAAAGLLSSLSAGAVELADLSVADLAKVYREIRAIEAHAHRLPDPVEYIPRKMPGVRLWGFEPWPTHGATYDPAWPNTHPKYPEGSGQVRVLRAIQKHRHVVVISASDVGKTFLASCLVDWYVKRPDSLMLITSGTWSQLQAQLWFEYQSHHARFSLSGRPTQKGLEGHGLPEKARVHLRSTVRQGNFTGFHAEHVFVMVDEAHAAPNWLFRTIQHGIADKPDARVIAFGNPIEAAGPYYALTKDHRWHVINLSQWDYLAWVEAGNEPIPAMVGIDEPAHKLTEFGEDDPYYQTYVLGQFPKAGLAALFSPVALSQAFDRRVEMASADNQYEPHLPGVAAALRVGIDVAALGGDRTVAYWRKGRVLRKFFDIGAGDPEVRNLPAGDRARFLSMVADRLDIAMRELPETPSAVVVDADGLGVGLAHMLAERGLPVVEFHAQAVPRDRGHAERYRDDRALMYWLMSEALPHLDIDYSDRLHKELVHTREEWTSVSRDGTKRGVRGVRPKDGLRRDLGHSPDEADAAAMTFCPNAPYEEQGDFSDLDEAMAG